MESVFQGLGIRVELRAKAGISDPKEKYRDSFLKVRETLTRIGIASTDPEKPKTLWQSAHILHKRGQYAILSFKELFLLDGKESVISVEDINRRNIITALLEEWDLLTILDEMEISDEPTRIKIIPFSEKRNWELRPKYTIGTKKR